jgi:nucleotide-binding universal stress UspA family protein
MQLLLNSKMRIRHDNYHIIKECNKVKNNQMLFKNILVPYDDSAYSIHAFKIAVDLAKKYDSKITIVTCLESDFRTPWYGYDSRASGSILKKQKEILQKSFSKLEVSAKKDKVTIISKILQDKSVVNAIVSFAKTQKIDLVVMGSHGRAGFDRFLLGSVANGVSQKVKCPVLIIK